MFRITKPDYGVPLSVCLVVRSPLRRRGERVHKWVDAPGSPPAFLTLPSAGLDGEL